MSISRQFLIALLTGTWRLAFVQHHTRDPHGRQRRTRTIDDLVAFLYHIALTYPIGRSLLRPCTSTVEQRNRPTDQDRPRIVTHLASDESRATRIPQPAQKNDQQKSLQTHVVHDHKSVAQDLYRVPPSGSSVIGSSLASRYTSSAPVQRPERTNTPLNPPSTAPENLTDRLLTPGKPRTRQKPRHVYAMPPNDVIAIIMIVIFGLVIMIGLAVYWMTVLTRPRKVVVAEVEKGEC